MIKIIGLGEGKKETLTIEVYEILKESKKIYVKDEESNRIEAFIKDMEICKISEKLIVDRIIEQEKNGEDIVYATMGNPKEDDSCTSILISRCEKENVDYKVFKGISICKNENRNVYDLLDLVDILRSENGCPWDREQTHESIENALIEEGYEVIDAINNHDQDNLIEELGDLLFQIAFHVSLEKGNFTIGNVVDCVYDKMVYRHPHVFGDTKVKDTNEVLSNWDELKKKEKSSDTYTDEMKRIAKSLPALIRASKVQSKARKVGFDWDNVEDAFYKVIEELNEVKDVYNKENKSKIKEEVGDLIFSCVNVARLLDINSEEALNGTTQKFINRFEFIELESLKNNKKIQELTLDEMNKLWDKAKKIEKSTK